MTEPPGMFRRPADAPEPLVPLCGSDTISTLHLEWARTHATPDADAPLSRRLRWKARARTARFGMGSDEKLMGDVVRALDAVASRCDELSDRVRNLEVTLEDLSRVLGEEVTRLRASVERNAAPSPPAESPTSR